MENKQQVIQVHRLLAEIKTDIEEKAGVDDLAHHVQNNKYQEIGVAPNHIHKSKKDQEEAVLALSNLITDAMDELDEELTEENKALAQSLVDEQKDDIGFTDYS